MNRRGILGTQLERCFNRRISVMRRTELGSYNVALNSGLTRSSSKSPVMNVTGKYLALQRFVTAFDLWREDQWSRFARRYRRESGAVLIFSSTRTALASRSIRLVSIQQGSSIRTEITDDRHRRISVVIPAGGPAMSRGQMWKYVIQKWMFVARGGCCPLQWILQPGPHLVRYH